MGLLEGHAAAADWDELQARVQSQYRFRLHWNNISGDPFWVGGVPIQKKRLGLSTVTLSPGCSVQLLLPADRFIRAYREQGKLSGGDLQFWVSDGSGLQVLHGGLPSPDGKSLVALPDRSGPSLVRIARPANCQGPLTLALFVSYREDPGSPVSYRTLACSPDPEFEIKNDRGISRRYHRVDPTRPIKVRVKGPVRLKLETRLQFPPQEELLEQSYQLRVFSGRALLKVLNFETRVDGRQVSVDDMPVPLGQRQTRYLEIPAGCSELILDSTASLYLRVLEQDQPEYHLSTNRPPLSSEEAKSWGYLFADRISHWNLSPGDFDAAAWNGNGTDGIPLLADRSARDNSRPQGPLRSFFLLRAVAAFRTDDAELRELAQLIRGRHSFFRDLVPVQASLPLRQRLRYFLPRELKSPLETDDHVVIAEQHIDELAARLSSGQFVQLPDNREQANVYRLPADIGSTILQVAVEHANRNGPATFCVQFDDGPVATLLAVGGPELPPKHYSAGRTEMGLSLFAARHGVSHTATLEGPFSQLRTPAPLISTGRAEIVVPAGVSEIRLWSPASPKGSLSAALRYLDSKPFRLTETEYLDAARRAGVAAFGPRLFVAALQDSGYVSADQFAEKELRNHWHFLLAWLRQEDASFRQGLVNTPSAVSPTKAEFRPTNPTERLVLARDSGYWLAKLEAWSIVLPFVQNAERREALFGRVTALRHLGEDNLYETELKGLFLFDRDPSVRAEAASRLKRLYADQGNELAQLRLQAVHTLENPSPGNLFELARLLADRGRAEDALALALVLPADEETTRLVLRMSLRARWWQHFETALARLPDPAERNYWRAWQLLAQGKIAEALGHLQQAANHGIALSKHIREGEQIREGLRHLDPTSRSRAVFRWERWSDTLPVPRIWTRSHSLISDYESSGLVISPSLRLNTQYYIGTIERPVTLTVQGPIRLQITGRPLHSPGESVAIEDWMIIETSEQRRQIPINNNHVSEAVEFANRPKSQPGRRVMEELELGPGRHTVRVFAESVPLAVSVEQWEPERLLPVLPSITTDTMTAAINGSYEVTNNQNRHVARKPSVDDREDLASRLYAVEPLPLQFELRPGVIPADMVHRVLLRLGRLPDQSAEGKTRRFPSDNVSRWTDCSPRERYSLLASLGCSTETEFEKLPLADREGILWKKGLGEEAVKLPLDSRDFSAVRRRLSSYLRLYELDQDHPDDWLAFGEYFFRRHAHLFGLRDIHTRLVNHGKWSLTTQIESSAGLRTVPAVGWQPEMPFLRIRKTLIGPLQPDEQVLTGDQELLLRVVNQRATQMTLTAELANPPYRPLSPLTFAWQLDSGKEDRQELNAERNQATVSVTLPAGEHILRVRCVEPWVNQFLRVRFIEKDRGEKTTLKRDVNRVWHVATSSEPLIVPLEGPVLVRIDELVDGTTTNELRMVPEGLHRLILPPTDGRREGLYRVYQLSYDPNRKPGRLQRQTYPREEAESPYLLASYPNGPSLDRVPQVRLIPETREWAERCQRTMLAWVDVNHGRDFLWEAKGVWSVGGGYFRRRPLLEGIDGGNRPDEFWQLNLDHHRRREESRAWKETNLLFRERVLGGETLGMVHSMRHEFGESPWSLNLQASGYLERIDESAGEDWEGSLDLRTRLTRHYEIDARTDHYPQITLFHRLISLDFNPYPSGVIDQDVFTPFKRDHRRGVILAEYLSHRPWLDTRWWLRPALMTNEDFNVFQPDNLGVTLGWEQWVRPFAFDLSYRATAYFHDADRTNSDLQHLVTLEGLTEGWVWGKVRLETSVFLQHELNDGDNSLAAVVSLTWDEGFNDWHYRPGEEDFQTIRRWRGAEPRSSPLLDWR